MRSVSMAGAKVRKKSTAVIIKKGVLFMALFDKIGNMTKSISDKTGDMLEITKLNSKINNEKNKISSLKTKIGDYYWSKFESGMTLDTEAQNLCVEIKESINTITALETEIQKIKSGGKEINAEAQNTPDFEVVTYCGNCGAAIDKGKKFCSECGTPVSPQ